VMVRVEAIRCALGSSERRRPRAPFFMALSSTLRVHRFRLSPQDKRMHFEVPSLPHSVKEFAAHYLMIVVSILTALGLEATVEHLHHKHAAEAAQKAVEAELRDNLADLRADDAKNLQRLGPLKQLSDELIKDFDDGLPIAQIKQKMVDRVKAGIDFGVFYPSLQHEAWDVAVANQSASYMEPEVLRRLSAAYASQRDVNQASLTVFVNVPAYLDALTDARVGAADPREFLRSIRQAEMTVKGAHAKFVELERQLEEALPDEPRVQPAAEAIPPASAPAHAASA
jgi:hypothetical protein